MASTNSQLQSVQFSVNWKIKLSEFDKLLPPGHISKTFFTSYKNVPLGWAATLTVFVKDSGIQVGLSYFNVPMEKFDNMECAFSIIKSDSSIAKTARSPCYEAKLRSGYGFPKYIDDKDPAAIRAKYGLEISDPLVLAITLKIPISVFSYVPTASPSAVPQTWFGNFFADTQEAILKFSSRDQVTFFVNKVVAVQSDALRSMISHPRPDGQPENEYKFELASDPLNALVQFLYSGQADLANLTSRDLIELIKAAEMYDLKTLKELCVVDMWKEVKNPKYCVEILRFAHLHDDLKDLKYRAMDVLADNYESAYSVFLFGGGQQGDSLRGEFHFFQSCRVEPNWAAKVDWYGGYGDY